MELMAYLEETITVDTQYRSNRVTVLYKNHINKN